MSVVFTIGMVRIESGDRIFPVFKKFSRQWMAKDPVDQLTTQEFVSEHEEYVRSNPHEDDLLKLFNIARIEYGRDRLRAG